MIDMWTVRYRNRTTDDMEALAVYSYPSGGVGLSASDPELTDAMGSTHMLALSPGQPMEELAGRLADMICHLTGGTVEYHVIDHAA